MFDCAQEMQAADNPHYRQPQFIFCEHNNGPEEQMRKTDVTNDQQRSRRDSDDHDENALDIGALPTEMPRRFA